MKTSTVLTILAAGVGGYFALRAWQRYQANQPRYIQASYNGRTGVPGNPYTSNTDNGLIYL